MNLLHQASEQKKFDVRVVEKHVSRNVVHADEVDKFLKQLPDDGANAEWSNIEKLAQDNSKA